MTRHSLGCVLVRFGKGPELVEALAKPAARWRIPFEVGMLRNALAGK